MQVLDQKDATELTADQIRQAVIKVAKKDYQLTVPQFLAAIKSGKLNKSDYAVRELLVWIEALPDDDPLFIKADGEQCAA
jgi:hypothetical protein